MGTVDIDFQGMRPSAVMAAKIRRWLENLERRFGRITAGRVAVRAPGHHHRTGGLYAINIHLSLPDGREVKVSRTSQDDERYARPAFAISDAFKRARRQLQDHVRRMQGKTKRHPGQPIGTVITLDPEGKFGFLETSDGREIYFHANSVLNRGFSRLQRGARVLFTEETGEKGPQASTVKRLGKHRMR
jgi:cold shock CspA family protein